MDRRETLDQKEYLEDCFYTSQNIANQGFCIGIHIIILIVEKESQIYNILTLTLGHVHFCR